MLTSIFSAKTPYLLIISLLSGMALAKPQTVEQANTITEITHAAYTGNIEALQVLSEQTTGYSQAYVLYRQAQQSMQNTDTSQFKQTVKKAENLLVNETDMESQVLLASIYGLMIAEDPSAGARLGPQIGSLLYKTKQDPIAGSRALLLEGIGKLYTPAEYGGGADHAESILKLAIERFDAVPVNTPINWGKTESHIWLGVAYAKQDKSTLAKAAFNKALELDPECTWVHYFAKNAGIEL